VSAGGEDVELAIAAATWPGGGELLARGRRVAGVDLVEVPLARHRAVADVELGDRRVRSVAARSRPP
jgi:hypothetical protein